MLPQQHHHNSILQPHHPQPPTSFDNTAITTDHTTTDTHYYQHYPPQQCPPVQYPPQQYMDCTADPLLRAAACSSSSTTATGVGGSTGTPSLYATDSSSSVTSISGGGGGGKRSKLVQMTAKEEDDLCKALLQLQLIAPDDPTTAGGGDGAVHGAVQQHATAATGSNGGGVGSIPTSRWAKLADIIVLNSTTTSVQCSSSGAAASSVQCSSSGAAAYGGAGSTGRVLVGSTVEEKLQLQYEGVKGLRTMLSVVGNIPIQAVVDSGVVPALTDILGGHRRPYAEHTAATGTGGGGGVYEVGDKENNVVVSGGTGLMQRCALVERALQFEAAWVLTNIASGSSAQTQAVVAAGGLERLVALLETHQGDAALHGGGAQWGCPSESSAALAVGGDQEELSEQAIWGIGNIGGDQTQYRDYVLQRRTATDALLAVCVHARKLETVRTGVWCMSNLCRGKPRPPYCSAIRSFVPYLRNCLVLSNDPGVLTDAAWAFEGIADSPAGLRATVASGIVPRLIDLLTHNNTNVVRPALRVLGQLATGTAEETQAIVDAGAVPVLARMLASPVQYLRKDASWTVSNIAAGTPQQLQALIDGEVFIAMGHILTNDEDSSIRMEAAWAFVNASTTNDAAQLEALLACGCMQAIVATVTNHTGVENVKILSVALTALEALLKFGCAKSTELGLPMNLVTTALLELGIVPRLLELQRVAEAHNRYPLWDKTVQLLNGYLLTNQ